MNGMATVHWASKNGLAAKTQTCSLSSSIYLHLLRHQTKAPTTEVTQTQILMITQSPPSLTPPLLEGPDSPTHTISSFCQRDPIRFINATRRYLNATNPNLNRDCWLWLGPQLPFHILYWISNAGGSFYLDSNHLLYRSLLCSLSMRNNPDIRGTQKGQAPVSSLTNTCYKLPPTLPFVMTLTHSPTKWNLSSATCQQQENPPGLLVPTELPQVCPWTISKIPNHVKYMSLYILSPRFYITLGKPTDNTWAHMGQDLEERLPSQCLC